MKQEIRQALSKEAALANLTRGWQDDPGQMADSHLKVAFIQRNLDLEETARLFEATDEEIWTAIMAGMDPMWASLYFLAKQTNKTVEKAFLNSQAQE